MGDIIKKTSHAIVLFQGKILLVLRDNKPDLPDPNTWTFPGGRMRMGEDFASTIRRELQEEIGIVPQNIVEIGLIINTVTRSQHHMYVSVLTPEEAGGVKLGNEGQELKFFTFSEMQGIPQARYVGKLLSQYGEGLKKLIETGEVDKKLLGFDENDVLYL